ncbi:MAG: hypothetical protein M0R30_05110 [Methanoregula sp.]|jgi:F0F1-type ATP synthase assembly protein I|uniref:hypothetical protein n=1 Tax=Methanoregula sp. TaxID=2052170 RepID=UPI0025F50A28|nr:hypothetical protein [Methanoregula sp.]MCK9631002.1 hypothetical protein [Methanoregula sp.]
MSGPGVPEQPGPLAASSLTAFRCGLLHAFGGFDTNDLSGEEQAGITEKKSWFWLGEVMMAALMAATIAAPAGIAFAAKTTAPLAVIGTVIVFLPLFVFMPKMIRLAVKTDTEAVLDMIGKNEQIKKVFWTLFLTVAGLVLAEIADPVTAQQILATLTGLV